MCLHMQTNSTALHTARQLQSRPPGSARQDTNCFHFTVRRLAVFCGLRAGPSAHKSAQASGCAGEHMCVGRLLYSYTITCLAQLAHMLQCYVPKQLGNVAQQHVCREVPSAPLQFLISPFLFHIAVYYPLEPHSTLTLVLPQNKTNPYKP